jgi:hypothetical protein
MIQCPEAYDVCTRQQDHERHPDRRSEILQEITDCPQRRKSQEQTWPVRDKAGSKVVPPLFPGGTRCDQTKETLANTSSEAAARLLAAPTAYQTSARAAVTGDRLAATGGGAVTETRLLLFHLLSSIVAPQPFSAFPSLVYFTSFHCI